MTRALRRGKTGGPAVAHGICNRMRRDLSMEIMHQGSCLCGAVSFTIEGELGPSDACHCTMCRKVSGHFWASTDVPREAITISGEDELGWYRSSGKVRRGFCRNCGSALFWDGDGRASLAVAMGALEGPTGVQLEKHIFVHEKGDYYEIADGLPRHGSSPGEIL